MRVTTQEKPFKYSKCKKTFSQAGNLKKQERSHIEEKPKVGHIK